MTIRRKLEEYLVSQGMFESQAAEVIEAMMADNSSNVMGNRWSDQVDGYSAALLRVLVISARREALKWIDKECPLAWFRPMFEDAEVGAAR